MLSRTIQGLTLICLSTSLAQAQSANGLKLPQAMTVLNPKLVPMIGKVNRASVKLGLKGWPVSMAPDGDSSGGRATRTKEALADLPNIVSKVWANDQVLWVRLQDGARWDAIVIMEPIGAEADSELRRMVWVRDAFGHCELKVVFPTDTWGPANVLCWEGSERTSYRFDELPKPEDVEADWCRSIDGKCCEFSCAPPESDAGLRLGYHPRLGIAFQVDDVDANSDNDGSMGLILSPIQFRAAKVFLKEGGRVWFTCPDRGQNQGPILCLAPEKLFYEWTLKSRKSGSPRPRSSG